MQLADAHTHRALAYIAALWQQGHVARSFEIEEYVREPLRRETGVLGAAGLLNFYASMRAEGMVPYLARLQWVRVIAGDEVHLTDIGEAFLRALDEREVKPDEVLELVLTPDDPFALARVMGRLADAGPAMLVDPYFGLDQLGPVAARTRITRVLVGDRAKAKERAELETAVPTLPVDRPFEVRVAPQKLHDRYLISDRGPGVQIIGTSLNGVGRVLTAMARLSDAGGEIRRAYEELWSTSTVLARAAPRSDQDPESPVHTEGTT